VVLGAAVWAGGRPSPSLERRVLHGVSLTRSGDACSLIMTGGVGLHPPAEAEVMRSIAVENGVPDSEILTETKATTTLESAVFCADLLRAEGWTEAWVVTDFFHMPRSLLLFRCVGIRAWPSWPDRSGAGTTGSRWAYRWLREVAALPWSLLRIVAIRLGIIAKPSSR
jgi:uncharacterized SAM-binding protein YcdF (DUF218 family)